MIANSSDRRKKAFTLVELLVVIAIIGVLVALLLPAVQAAREAARRSTCMSRIRQLSLAALNYESALGHFPSASEALDPNADPATRRDYSWIAFLLPYFEQQGLRDSIVDTLDWFEPQNELPSTTPLTVIRCPSRTTFERVNLNGPGNDPSIGFGDRDDSDLRTHFFGVLGANTELDRTLPHFCADRSSIYSLEIVEGGSSRGGPPCVTGGHGVIANSGIIYRFSNTEMGEVSDGTSNTFLIGESAFGDPQADTTRPWIVGANGFWMYTSKNVAYAINSGDRPGPSRNNIGFGSEHPGGCHFAYADGSANFFSENIDLVVLFNLATRNDGQVVDSTEL